MSERRERREGRERLLRAFQVALAAGGGLLVAVALLADAVGLSRYPGIGPGEGLLIAAGLLAALANGAVWAWRRPAGERILRRVGRGYQAVAVGLVSVAAGLLALDLLAGLLFDPRSARPPDADAYYAAQPWGDALWAEYDALDYEYAPYVLWRHAPAEGEAITVGPDGRRAVPGAEAVADPEAPRLWALGGSTMWGYGSPDDGTIPARLQARLRGADPPVRVESLGEDGWVSTQGVIALLLALQRGEVPDGVVSWDGINEVAAPFDAGRVAHHSLARTEALLEGRVLPTVAKQSVALSVLGRRLASPEDYVSRGVDPEALADAIARAYLANYRVVALLAERHGFRFAFCWQPWIGSCAKEPTPEEERIRARIDPDLTALFDAVYARIAAAAPDHPRLFDLSGALDAAEGQVWIDQYHVTPEANAVLADAILAAWEEG